MLQPLNNSRTKHPLVAGVFYVLVIHRFDLENADKLGKNKYAKKP